MSALQGQVAVVAGATRGAGRGIARMLGAAGATVVCTGRSSRAMPRPAPRPGRPFELESRPETIEETAALVDAAGGRGVAVRVDHTVEAEVAALFARVQAEQGRLDLLVNDVWGGDALSQWGTPFWELDLAQAQRLLHRAVLSHLITSRHGAPLMVRAGRGLIVEITDGESAAYRGNLPYDLAKAAAIRMALGMAEELRPHGVTAVALTPGFLRSEAMLEHFGVTEANWREAARRDPHFIASESPAYVGRAVAALAADPALHRKSGQALSSWGLAREYGFTDEDGSQPDWGRHMAEGAHTV